LSSFKKLSQGIVLDRQVRQRYFYDSKAAWFSTLKGTPMTNWETPSFEEIDMSAEIGSYQGEDDNGL
jgi:coenzyme PQQ precursor peptide PqqA